MRLRCLPLALTVILSSCALFHRPAPRLQEDLSIRFPSFHERSATAVGDEQGQPYELDGVTLRALAIAANDFIPPNGDARQCWERQEAHRYRVIRRDDILFVQIYLDPLVCKQMVMDGGVMYAISIDGRILRRLFDGEPEQSGPDFHEVEEPPSRGTPVPNSQVGSTSAPIAPDLPAFWFDGGAPDAGAPGQDGGVQTPDAG